MTRLRTESQLGWGLCQFLGETCLPSVTVDAVKRAEARERLMITGRRSGKRAALKAAVEHHARTAKPSREAQPVVLDETGFFDEEAFAEIERTMGRTVLITAPGARVQAVDTDEHAFTVGQTVEMTLPDPPPEVAFWWLSYANDEGCAGVAIVRLRGEQSTERAAERARQLGLEPKGEWEIAAFSFPADGDEAELALMARHADRFLTTTEAEAAFAAQSIGSFEAETGRTVDTSGVGVSHTKGSP